MSLGSGSRAVARASAQDQTLVNLGGLVGNVDASTDIVEVGTHGSNLLDDGVQVWAVVLLSGATEFYKLECKSTGVVSMASNQMSSSKLSHSPSNAARVVGVLGVGVHLGTHVAHLGLEPRRRSRVLGIDLVHEGDNMLVLVPAGSVLWWRNTPTFAC